MSGLSKYHTFPAYIPSRIGLKNPSVPLRALNIGIAPKATASSVRLWAALASNWLCSTFWISETP